MDDRVLALLLAVGTCAGLWLASKVYRASLARRGVANADLGTVDLPRDGLPVVLGFSGDYCQPCVTQQRPALERLRAQVGAAAHIREIDALAHADLAKRFGVLTVPTTVVLDGRRRLVAINYGVTSTEKLRGQLEGRQPLAPARQSRSERTLPSNL